MRCGKQGSSAKRRLPILVLGGFIGLIVLIPANAQQQIHRNGFEGKQTSWLRGEDNVRAEEKTHSLSSEYARSGTNSEFIQLICPDAKNEANQATYYYPTPPAPVSDDLIASVYVKANRSGIQFQARLVLPKERNPKQIDEPMTVIITGDTYKLTRRWQKLDLSNPMKLIKDQQQLLRLQLQRDVDLTDAYIDRLIVNLYTGPGQIDVYLDDLEIGPVRQQAPPQPKFIPKKDGITVTLPKPTVERPRSGYPVRMEGDKLFVDNKPFFFRAIRYSDTPLKTLRDAGFNTIWFDSNVPVERIEEAIGHGFWIVPSLPLLGDSKPDGKGTLTSRGGNDLATARDVEGLATAITRFISGDSVLFWDLGGALQIEKMGQLEQTARAVGLSDPHRPRGADFWDGFGTGSHFIEMVGTHRYPLLTSLELTKYRDWLTQRRQLTAGNALHWTWIQTHIPDWQTQLVYGKKSDESYKEPIGPQPEQIRLLTYLGMAAGCRGLAFSSDRFLADSHQGRDRLLMMALLNQEITMLEPILLSLRDAPSWIETNNPFVKAAVLRSDKGILVMPIWLGGGAQYVPQKGDMANLTMIVPLIPDGAQPWELSPARVQSLEFNSQRTLSGTKIVLPEFDLTSAIVFTSDLTPSGLVVQWQNHSRRIAPQAAQWARDLAIVQLEKVRKTHLELEELAPPVLNAIDLLRQSETRIEQARKYEQARDYPNAYFEAMRALRPLRIIMRAHWEHATRTIDFPSASPFAVSYFTLPRHWELHRELKGTTAGANALRDGDFEAVANRTEFVPAARKKGLEDEIPKKDEKKDKDGKIIKSVEDLLKEREEKARNKYAGAPIASLPGWTMQQETLDAVELQARLVPSELARVVRPEKKPKKKDRYDPSNGLNTDAPDPPEPTLGESVLRLVIDPKIVLSKDGKPQPAPAALERTYLAVSSPAVRLQPGTWVRISGWVCVPATIQASADGMLLYDSAGGEAMGLRLTEASGWKKYHFYRKVPASGVVWVTVALTGIGTVYVDDLRIEPLIK